MDIPAKVVDEDEIMGDSPARQQASASTGGPAEAKFTSLETSVFESAQAVDQSQYLTKGDFALFMNQLQAQIGAQMATQMFRLNELAATMGTPRSNDTPPQSVQPGPSAQEADEVKQNEQSTNYFEDIPMGRTSYGNTPRAPRRATIFEDVDGVANRNADVLLNAPLPMMRVEKEIPDSMKIDYITLRAFARMVRNWENWLNTRREQRLYAEFLSPNILRTLVHVQEILAAPGWEHLNEHNICRAMNDSIKKYYSDALRLPLNGRRDLFIETFITSVNGMKPLKNAAWDPNGILGWEEEIFTPLSELLKEIKENYSLLYYGLSQEVAAGLSPPIWGDNDEQGLLQFCMYMLDNGRPRGNDGRGTYYKIFFNRIGKPRLKLLKSVDEWASAILAESQLLSKESQRLRREQATLVGPPTVARVNEQMLKRQVNHAPLERGRNDNRRWEPARKTPFNRKQDTYLKKLLGINVDEEADAEFEQGKTSGLDADVHSGNPFASLVDRDGEFREQLDQAIKDSAQEAGTEPDLVSATESDALYTDDEREQKADDNADDYREHLAAMMGHGANARARGPEHQRRPGTFPLQNNNDRGDHKEARPFGYDPRQPVRMWKKADGPPRHHQGQGQQHQRANARTTGAERYLVQNLSEADRARYAKMPCLDHYENKCTRGGRCAFDHSSTAMQKLTEDFKRKIEAHARGHGAQARQQPPPGHQQFRMLHGASLPEEPQQLRIIQRPTTTVSRFSPDYVEPDQEADDLGNRAFYFSQHDEAGEQMIRKATC